MSATDERTDRDNNDFTNGFDLGYRAGRSYEFEHWFGRIDSLWSDMVDAKRAAIAAMDAELSLEDMLREWVVTEALCDGVGASACSASVSAGAFEIDNRWGRGTGSTIAAAIRAAIANAKGGE